MLIRKPSAWIAIISFLSLFLWISEGEKIWNGVSSIVAVQGQSITMKWLVNLTSADESQIWSYAKIIQVEDGKTTELMSLQKSGTKIIDDPRYQSRKSDLNLNVSQIGATVIIKFTIQNLLRSMDEKQYKTMLGFPSDSSTFPGATSLVIRERPHTTTIAASPNQTSYCLDDRITITCVSHAYPSANYDLYRNDILVQNGDSSGVFVVSTVLTDKILTCVPYNTLGTGENQSFQISVKEPPKILWCKTNNANKTNSTIVEGSKVTLMCKISGSEPIHVTWTHLSSPRPAVTRWNKQNLTFNVISHKEEGWYRMDVNNGRECNISASATFHLNVNYKPADTSVSILPNQSSFCINDQITIVCKTKANPTAEFSFYQNNQPIQTGSKSGTLKMFLSLKGAIVLGCVPSNILGNGQSKNIQVFVIDRPSISRCRVNNRDLTNITVNEGTKVTFECESSGSRPLNVTWTKEGSANRYWNEWNLTFKSVSRNDHGSYRVAVFSGQECNTAVSKTFHLVVNYINKPQVIGNNFKVFNKSTALVWFEIFAEAYPDAALICQSLQLNRESVVVHRTKKGNEPTKTHFVVTVNTTNVEQDIRLKCTLENKVGSQTTGFLIYKQVTAKKVVGSMKLLGQEWNQGYNHVNNEAYKKLKEKGMNMLNEVYQDIPYVIKWNVLRFTPGSVVMYFELFVIAEVPDPFIPLRIAVENNGGYVGNLMIDPTKIQITDNTEVNSHKQIKTNSRDVVIAVLGVIAAISLVVNVILVVFLLRGKGAKEKRRNENDEASRQDKLQLKTVTEASAEDSDYDYPYDHVVNKQATQSQSTPKSGIDNPSMASPSETNEKPHHTRENSQDSPDTKKDETGKEPYNTLNRQGHERRTTTHKNYNSLDSSGRLNSPSDLHPASLEETRKLPELPNPPNAETNGKNQNEVDEDYTFPVSDEDVKSSKRYNSLSSSTKIPSRDDRPSLELPTPAAGLDNKHRYQNQEEKGASPCGSQAVENKETT